MKYTKLFITLWFVALIIIIILSLSPKISPPEKYNIDKFLHCSAYLFLCFLSTISFRTDRTIFFNVVLLIFVAALTEIGQHFVPHRTASFGDFAANTIGIMLGYLIGKLVRKKFFNFHV
jgi:VanZ family protein